MITNHDEYWRQVKSDSEECLDRLFEDGGSVSIADVLGHSKGISCRRDADEVLAYVMRHGDAGETACAILALGDWMQACNELKERDASDGGSHSSAEASAKAE